MENDSTLKAYDIKLFVSSKTPESVLAGNQLKKFFDQHIKNPLSLEMIDIALNPEKALEYSVVAVPMLILVEPKPKVTIIGSMRDTQKLFTALRLRLDD